MLNRLRPVLRAIALGAAMVVGLADRSLAATERRVALVIGNGAYKRAPALENPTIDAKGMAAALRRIGFEVIDGYDLGFSEMRAKLSEFATALPDSKAALVYYAGHGVSVEEDNFLLPVDIELKSVTDLDINAINVDLVLRQMKREERVNVVILDACRDNPFARELAASTKNRSAVSDRGLSRIDVSAKGTLIAFATDPKSTAADGPKGSNSPFTHALLKHIETPGISIDTVLNRVRADVWEATNKKQMPWVNTSLIGEFIMNPVAVSAQAPMTVAALSPRRLPGGWKCGGQHGVGSLDPRTADVGFGREVEPAGRLPGLCRLLPQRRLCADGSQQDRPLEGRRARSRLRRSRSSILLRRTTAASAF